MRITAAVVRAAGAPFALETLTLDGPQSDEVLVRVVAAGICHTDIGAQHGHIPVPLPAVLGHEGAGVVEAVGADVTGIRPGDHVLLSQAFCGHCASCGRHEPAYCTNAQRLSLGGRREDGSVTLHAGDVPVSGNFVGQSSFATHAIAKARNVYVVDADLPLGVLAPLGCGIMTGAGTIFNDARMHGGESVAVFGAGAVGLAAMMAARTAGASTIVAVDLVSSRLELATRLGATHTFVAGDDAAAAIVEATGGGVDVAIEAAGAAPAAVAAVACTHKRGRTIIVGAAPFGTKLELDWWSIVAGRTVRGSVVGSSDPATDLPRLVGMWRSGDLPMDELVTTYPFDRINDAVVDAASSAAVKPVLVVGDA